MNNPRPEVLAFADMMEQVLAENDYKGGWTECKLNYLISRLGDEKMALDRAVRDYTFRYPSDRPLTERDQENRRQCASDAVKECVDLANFAMMIALNILAEQEGENDR